MSKEMREIFGNKEATPDDIRPYLDKARSMAKSGASVEAIQDLLVPGFRGLIARHVMAHQEEKE